MPGEYRIYPDDGLVVVLFSGTVTAALSRQTMASYFRDPAADPSHDYLVDFSAATEFTIDFQEMFSHVSRLEKTTPRRAPGAKTALLSSGDVAYGIGRMYQSLAEGRLDHEIGVFRTLKEALAFLERTHVGDDNTALPLP